MSYNTGKILILPYTENALGYDVRLLHSSLAVHWGKSIVITLINFDW